MTNTEIILSKYSDGNSIRNIVKTTGIKRRFVAKTLQENNIYIISNVEKLRKYKIDENYFDVIDTEHKAYTLGFLYADGYNNEKKNIVKLSLIEEDVDILKQIREPICPDKPLRYYVYKSENRKPQYSFVIDNGHISRKLSEFGVKQTKTFKLKFPTFLDKSLIRHFIRGYFDGDGCITASSTIKYPKSFNYYVSFVSAEDFLIELQKYLFINLDIKIGKLQTRHREKNNNIRSLNINGNLQVEKLLNHLYDDSTIFLKRKYDKYIDLKNVNLLKYSKSEH